MRYLLLFERQLLTVLVCVVLNFVIRKASRSSYVNKSNPIQELV